MSKQNELYITRGDSYSLTVIIKDQDGNVLELEQEDTVYFTVKKSTETSTIALQKIITSFTEEGYCNIEIEPQDTKEFRYGNYVYDIQVSYANGNVLTIIKPSRLIIGEEVTYD